MPSQIVQSYRTRWPVESASLSDDDIVEKFLRSQTPEELQQIDPTFQADYQTYTQKRGAFAGTPEVEPDQPLPVPEQPTYNTPISSPFAPVYEPLHETEQEETNYAQPAFGEPTKVRYKRGGGVEEGSEGGATFGQHIQQALHSGITEQVASFLTLPTDLLSAINMGVFGSDEDKPEDEFFGKISRAIGDPIKNIIPEVPQLKDSFLASTLPGALGSAASILTGTGAVKVAGRALIKKTALGSAAEAAAIARAAGKSGDDLVKAATDAYRGTTSAINTGITAGFGVAMGGQGGYRDAMAHGASPNEVFGSMLANAAVGASEAVPLTKMLNRIDDVLKLGTKTSHYTLERIITNAGKEGLEEALQEVFQGASGNLIASTIVGYDKNRELLNDLGADAAAGGISGVVFSLLTSAIGRHLHQRAQVKEGEQPPGGPGGTMTPDGTTPGDQTSEPITGTTEALATPRETLAGNAQRVRDAGGTPITETPEEAAARVANEKAIAQEQLEFAREETRQKLIRTQADSAQTGKRLSLDTIYVSPEGTGQTDTLTSPEGTSALVVSLDPGKPNAHPWSHQTGGPLAPIPSAKPPGDQNPRVDVPVLDVNAYKPGDAVDLQTSAGQVIGTVTAKSPRHLEVESTDGTKVDIIPTGGPAPLVGDAANPVNAFRVQSSNPLVVDMGGKDWTWLKRNPSNGELTPLTAYGAANAPQLSQEPNATGVGIFWDFLFQKAFDAGHDAIILKNLSHSVPTGAGSTPDTTTGSVVVLKPDAKPTKISQIQMMDKTPATAARGASPTVPIVDEVAKVLKIDGPALVQLKDSWTAIEDQYKELSAAQRDALTILAARYARGDAKEGVLVNEQAMKFIGAQPAAVGDQLKNFFTAAKTLLRTLEQRNRVYTQDLGPEVAPPEQFLPDSLRAQKQKEAQDFGELLKNGASFKIILELFKRGKSAPEIAAQVGVPEEQIRSVKTHLNIPDPFLPGKGDVANPAFEEWVTRSEEEMLKVEKPGVKPPPEPKVPLLKKFSHLEAAHAELKAIEADLEAERRGKPGRTKLTVPQQMAKEAYARGFQSPYDIQAALTIGDRLAEGTMNSTARANLIKRAGEFFFPQATGDALITPGDAVLIRDIVNGEHTGEDIAIALQALAKSKDYVDVRGFVREALLIYEATTNPRPRLKDTGTIHDYTFSQSERWRAPRTADTLADEANQRRLLDGRSPNLNTYEALLDRGSQELASKAVATEDGPGASIMEFLRLLENDPTKAEQYAFSAIDAINTLGATTWNMHDPVDRRHFVDRVRYDSQRSLPDERVVMNHPGQLSLAEFLKHPDRDKWAKEYGITVPKAPKERKPLDPAALKKATKEEIAAQKKADKEHTAALESIAEALKKVHRKAVEDSLSKGLVPTMDTFRSEGYQDLYDQAFTLRNTLNVARRRAKRKKLEKEDEDFAASVAAARQENATARNVMDSIINFVRQGGVARSLQGLSERTRRIFNRFDQAEKQANLEIGRREKVKNIREWQDGRTQRGQEITVEGLEAQKQNVTKEQEDLERKADAIKGRYKEVLYSLQLELHRLKQLQQSNGKSLLTAKAKKAFDDLIAAYEEHSKHLELGKPVHVQYHKQWAQIEELEEKIAASEKFIKKHIDAKTTDHPTFEPERTRVEQLKKDLDKLNEDLARFNAEADAQTKQEVKSAEKIEKAKNEIKDLLLSKERAETSEILKEMAKRAERDATYIADLHEERLKLQEQLKPYLDDDGQKRPLSDDEFRRSERIRDKIASVELKVEEARRSHSKHKWWDVLFEKVESARGKLQAAVDAQRARIADLQKKVGSATKGKDLIRYRKSLNMETGKLEPLIQKQKQFEESIGKEDQEVMAYARYFAELRRMDEINEERSLWVADNGAYAQSLDNKLKSFKGKKKTVETVRQEISSKIRTALSEIYDPPTLARLRKLGYTDDWWDAGSPRISEKSEKRLAKLEKWYAENTERLQGDWKQLKEDERLQLKELKELRNEADMRVVGLINIPVPVVQELILPESIEAEQYDPESRPISKLSKLPRILAVTENANEQWERYQEIQAARQVAQDGPITDVELDVEGSPVEGETESIHLARTRVERARLRAKTRGKGGLNRQATEELKKVPKFLSFGKDPDPRVPTGVQKTETEIDREKAHAKKATQYENAYQLHVGEPYAESTIPAYVEVGGDTYYGDMAQRAIDTGEYNVLGFLLSDNWHERNEGAGISHRVVAFEAPIQPGELRSKVVMTSIKGELNKDGLPVFTITIGSGPQGRAETVTLQQMLRLGFKPIASFRTVDGLHNYSYIYDRSISDEFERDWGRARERQRDFAHWMVRRDVVSEKFSDWAEGYLGTKNIEWTGPNDEDTPNFDSSAMRDAFAAYKTELKTMFGEGTEGEPEADTEADTEGESNVPSERNQGLADPNEVANTLNEELRNDPDVVSTTGSEEANHTYQMGDIGDALNPTKAPDIRWGEETRMMVANMIIDEMIIDNTRGRAPARASDIAARVFEKLENHARRRDPEEVKRHKAAIESAFIAGDVKSLEKLREQEEFERNPAGRHVIKQARWVAVRMMMLDRARRKLPIPVDEDGQPLPPSQIFSVEVLNKKVQAILTYAVRYARNSVSDQKADQIAEGDVDDGDVQSIADALGRAWTNLGTMGEFVLEGTNMAPVALNESNVNEGKLIRAPAKQYDNPTVVNSAPVPSSDGKFAENKSDPALTEEEVSSLFAKQLLIRSRSTALTTPSTGENFSPKEVKNLRQKFGHKQSVQQSLQFISDLQEYPPAFRTLARVLKHSGINARIEFINDPNEKFKGRFDLLENVILINMAYHYANDSRGNNVPDVGIPSVINTILHESTHAMVSRMIHRFYTSRDSLSKGQVASIQMMRELMLTANERGFFNLKQYRSEQQALNEFTTLSITDLKMMGRLSMEAAPVSTRFGGAVSGFKSSVVSMLRSLVESVKGLARSMLADLHKNGMLSDYMRRKGATLTDFAQKNAGKVAIEGYNASVESLGNRMSMLETAIENMFHLSVLRRSDQMEMDHNLSWKSEGQKKIDQAMVPMPTDKERFLFQEVSAKYQAGSAYEPITDANRNYDADLRKYVIQQNEIIKAMRSIYDQIRNADSGLQQMPFETFLQNTFGYEKGSDSPFALRQKALNVARMDGIQLTLTDEQYFNLGINDLESMESRPAVQRNILMTFQRFEGTLGFRLHELQANETKAKNRVTQLANASNREIAAASNRQTLDNAIQEALEKKEDAISGAPMSIEESEAALLQSVGNIARVLQITPDAADLKKTLAEIRKDKKQRKEMADALLDLMAGQPNATTQNAAFLREWMSTGLGTTPGLQKIAIDEVRTAIFLAFAKENPLLMEALAIQKLSQQDRSLINKVLQSVLANSDPKFASSQWQQMGAQLQRHDTIINGLTTQLERKARAVSEAQRAAKVLSEIGYLLRILQKPMADTRRSLEGQLSAEQNVEVGQTSMGREMIYQLEPVNYQFSGRQGDPYIVPATDEKGTLIPGQTVDEVFNATKVKKEGRNRVLNTVTATMESREQLGRDIRAITDWLIEQDMRAQRNADLARANQNIESTPPVKAQGAEVAAMRRIRDQLTEVQAGWSHEAGFGQHGWVSKLFASIVDFLNVNHPAFQRLRQRFKTFDDWMRRLNDIAEAQLFTIAKAEAWRMTGLTDAEFTDRFFHYPLGHLELRKDLLETGRGLSFDEKTELGINEMLKYLRSIQVTRAQLDGIPGLTNQLKAMWRAQTAVVWKTNMLRRDMKLKILDNRSADNGWWFRESIGHPLWTMPRRLRETLAKTVQNTNSQMWQSPDFVEFDKATGQPVTETDPITDAPIPGTLVRTNKMGATDLAGMYKTMRTQLDAALEKRFGKGIRDMFLRPLMSKEGSTAFETPEGAGGHTSLIPVEARVAAYNQASGDPVRIAEILFDEFGNGNAEARAAYVGKFLNALSTKWIQLVEFTSDKPVTVQFNILPIRDVIMDGRSQIEFPLEWLDYFQGTKEHWRRIVTQLSQTAAFGTNGIGLTNDFKHLESYLRKMVETWDSIRNMTPEAQRSYLANTNSTEPVETLKTAEGLLNRIRNAQFAIESVLAFNQNFDRDDRRTLNLVHFMASMTVQGLKTSLTDTFSTVDGSLRNFGFGRMGFGFLGSTVKSLAHEVLGTFFQAFGIQLAMDHDVDVLAAINGPMGQADVDALHSLSQRLIAQKVTPSTTSGMVQRLRQAQTLLRMPLKIPGTQPSSAAQSYVAFKPFSPFGMFTLWGHRAITRAYQKHFTKFFNGVASYMKNNPKAAREVNFQITAKMLFDSKYLPASWNLQGIQQFLNNMRDHGIAPEVIAEEQLGGKRWMDNPRIVAVVSSLSSTEMMYEASLGETPAYMLSGKGVYAAPLLRWAIQRSGAMIKMFQGPHGEQNWQYFLQGMLKFAAVVLPTTLLYALLRDLYDDEILGKKANELPLRLTGEEAWRSWFDAISRVGSLGIAGDAANHLVNFNTSKEFSMDSRIFLMSSIRSMITAAGRLANQEGAATWDSVGRPMVLAMGAGGYLQNFDIINNLVGADNFESRTTRRIHVNNLLRASGYMTPGMEVRPPAHGGYRVTPMTPWVSQMVMAAYANDRAAFNTAYRKAIKAAIADGSADPLESVASSYASRNPIKSLFVRPPTVAEYRGMLEKMGAQNGVAVDESIRNYNQFGTTIPRSSKRPEIKFGEIPKSRGITPYYGRDESKGRSALALMGYEAF